MAEPPYVDQSAEALRFHLLTESVDMQQFIVLREQWLGTEHFQVRAGILGASHFLTFTLPDGKMLNEIFACTTVHTAAPCIIAGPLGSLEPSVQSRFWNRVSYVFSPQVRAWHASVTRLENLRRRAARAAQRPGAMGMEFVFPTCSEDDRTPLTVVQADADAFGVTVETAHCYPNEERVVFTKSIITLTKQEGGP